MNDVYTMGIYTSGKIYGISIYTLNEGPDDEQIETLFARYYDAEMSDEQIKEVRLFYNERVDKENLHFRVYTECSSTYGPDVYMSWIPISRENFENIIT